MLLKDFIIELQKLAQKHGDDLPVVFTDTEWHFPVTKKEIKIDKKIFLGEDTEEAVEKAVRIGFGL